MPRALKALKVLTQTGAICLLLWGCDTLATLWHLSIPGSVIGLGVLLALLAVGLVPEVSVQEGSNWLMGEMLLFFIPPVVSVLKYTAMLEQDGWHLFLALLLGTTMVLVGTAFVVDKVFALEHRWREQGAAHAG